MMASLLTATALAQSSTVIVTDDILLPRDTTVKKELLTALNGFLAETVKTNKDNSFVLPDDLLATSALLDEMKDLAKSNKFKDSNFYQPYLTNATRFNDSNFLIQLSYMRIHENKASLRASFTLLAKKKEHKYYFNSPLKQNTLTWKTQQIYNVNIHYKNTFDVVKATNFFKMVADYDKKLNVPVRITEYYCADNFHEVLQLLGVDYKLDYNGYARNSETAEENNQYLNVNGIFTSEFIGADPHDTWHERLHKVLSTNIINRPVDEGTAYLYGGSWGLSWQEILDKFKAYAQENPNADWLALYNESKNFDPKGKYPLNVDFAINALVAQQIERKKGFPAVIELLSCGKKEKDNENYFKALEKISGISKPHFNEQVWALIKAS